MRMISPTFTVLDAQHMMPKIYAVVKSVTSGRVDLKPSEHVHSGYQHSFASEAESDSLEILTYFPTDEEIGQDLTIANQRAGTLVAFAGMDNLGDSLENSPLTPSTAAFDPYLTDDDPGKYLHTFLTENFLHAKSYISVHRHINYYFPRLSNII